jgi:hypothetical protein
MALSRHGTNAFAFLALVGFAVGSVLVFNGFRIAAVLVYAVAIVGATGLGDAAEQEREDDVELERAALDRVRGS